jgi:hypothetical protein
MSFPFKPLLDQNTNRLSHFNPQLPEQVQNRSLSTTGSTPWSKDETGFLFQQIQNYGNNWELIAANFEKMPTRRTQEVLSDFFSQFIIMLGMPKTIQRSC